MTVAVTAVLAAAAAAFWIGSPQAVLHRRLRVARSRSWTVIRRPLVAVGMLAAMVALIVQLGDRPHLILVALTLGAIAYTGVVLQRRAQLRSRRHQRQAEIVDICDAFVSELSAGSPPPRMLADAAADWPFLASVARTADMGGDVTQALRSLAASPGRAAFGDIAAAWEVSVRSGAGLAGVLDRLSRALREDDEARQEVIASLAAPRATARVLAALPVFGLALGAGLGGDPVGVLFETVLGAICLAVGSALAIGGLFWVEHIADAAEVG